MSDDVERSTGRDDVPLGKELGCIMSVLWLFDEGPSFACFTSLSAELVRPLRLETRFSPFDVPLVLPRCNVGVVSKCQPQVVLGLNHRGCLRFISLSIIDLSLYLCLGAIDRGCILVVLCFRRGLLLFAFLASRCCSRSIGLAEVLG